MENNKTPITLLDILTHAKSRGAKTLQEAMNITAKLNNEVTSDSQMTPYEEYNYLMKHGRTYEGNPIKEDSDIDYVIVLLQSPDYTIYTVRHYEMKIWLKNSATNHNRKEYHLCIHLTSNIYRPTDFLCHYLTILVQISLR